MGEGLTAMTPEEMALRRRIRSAEVTATTAAVLGGLGLKGSGAFSRLCDLLTSPTIPSRSWSSINPIGLLIAAIGLVCGLVCLWWLRKPVPERLVYVQVRRKWALRLAWFGVVAAALAILFAVV
jgi:hypothetical protein